MGRVEGGGGDRLRLPFAPVMHTWKLRHTNALSSLLNRVLGTYIIGYANSRFTAILNMRCFLKQQTNAPGMSCLKSPLGMPKISKTEC